MRGTRWRSCGDGGAFMAGVSSFGCGGPGWSSTVERGRNEQAATRRGALFQPALEQRPDPGLTARGLEGGVAHFGSKSARSARPVCARRYKITSARKSLTLV